MMHEATIDLIDALLGEHGLLYALFDELEARAASATTLAEAQMAAGPVASALLSHARIEDELLFPALERTIGGDGPLFVMRSEHQEIDDLLAAVAVAPDLGAATAAIAQAIELARDHFAKEERVLFPMARQALDDDERHRLGQQWARLRSVSL
jgi:iron-sulfur cluster repair protein YtfE (RIC family)